MSNKKSKNIAGEKFKSFDMFGTVPAFEIDGSSSLNSYCGACLSIMIGILTLFFFITRALIWIDNGDTAH